jgi:glycosyltransferase involved in cell wall biosynthesis
VTVNDEVRISVVMPVYNSDDYLHEAVDSILAQEFDGFEVLLVDDGSTDRSGILCDEYAAADSRVRVFHLPNGGMCAARNFGISVARGEYISFSDDDDECLPGFLSLNYELAKENNADLVRFGRCLKRYLGDHGDVVSKESVPRRAAIYRDAEVAEHYSEIGEFRAVWTGMFRKRVIDDNGLRFDERLRHGFEDVLFNIMFCEHCRCVVLNPKTLYVWKQRLAHSSSLKLNPDFLLGIELAGSEEAALMTRFGIRKRDPELYGRHMLWYLIDSLARVNRSGAGNGTGSIDAVYSRLRTIYKLPAFDLEGIPLGFPYATYYRLLMKGSYRSLERLTNVGIAVNGLIKKKNNHR